VRRLLAKQFPAWADLSIEPVPSAGTDNALYRLGDALSVRLPRVAWAVESIERECTWVPRLASHLSCAVPVPLAKGAPCEEFPWPWSVCRWVAGTNPTFDALIDFERLANDLAAFVVALRAIDPSGGPPASRGVPLAARDTPTRRAIGALQGVIDTAAATAA
jgi:aminoglycoside phosphotransferase (APT) family kinase protein